MAAMLIFGVTLFMFQRYTQNRVLSQVATNHTDTVFLDKRSVITEHDTVYVTMPSKNNKTMQIVYYTNHSTGPAVTPGILSTANGKIPLEVKQSMLSTAHIMSIKQKTIPTGNSLDEDSLSRKFKFVTM